MPPFAGYKNFSQCVKKNASKARNPKAYCGAIKHKVEGRKKKVASKRKKR